MIVVLSARADDVDVVLGLEAGADDYLTKPFRLPVLLARVRAHLRRQSPPAGATRTADVIDHRAAAAGPRRSPLRGLRSGGRRCAPRSSSC